MEQVQSRKTVLSTTITHELYFCLSDTWYILFDPDLILSKHLFCWNKIRAYASIINIYTCFPLIKYGEENFIEMMSDVLEGLIQLHGRGLGFT